MTHVITRACCNDAACVAVCPTNCIHPSPGDPGFATAEMLHIDPVGCIDCGACVEVCPVDAISPDHRLGPGLIDYLDLNRRYFDGVTYEMPGFHDPVRAPGPAAPLTVAVVGSGPAAMYAVEHLLDHLDDGSEVHVYERLPVPWGLVRHGVAPDHQDTKRVTRGFERLADDHRVHVHLNVDVGSDVTHDDLTAHHHAVLYAVGAPDPRPLGVPGEDLPGCISATELVAWYNGHPDHSGVIAGLAGRRVVVVGNGNVALDVARVLASGHRALEASDIADEALAILRETDLEEIVVLGRRGPVQAAYTAPELLALLHTEGVEVAVEEQDLDSEGTMTGPAAAKLKLLRRAVLAGSRSVEPGHRRVVLRFLSSPVEVIGEDSVAGVRIGRNTLVTSRDGSTRAERTDEMEELECSLVVHAVGYAGRPVAGLPFDEVNTRVPNDQGRVVDAGVPVPGVYVVGWAKRGPSGVIGTNKTCAEETVRSLLVDAAEGRLRRPIEPHADLAARLSGAVDLDSWRRLDLVEREAGRAAGRPRVKISDRDRMFAFARP